MQGLRDKGRVRPGQKVLINGSAGGGGTFAVQIAKSFGANVTGVCSTRKVDVVRSIGEDRVIDYTQQDFTESVDASLDHATLIVYTELATVDVNEVDYARPRLLSAPKAMTGTRCMPVSQLRGQRAN